MFSGWSGNTWPSMTTLKSSPRVVKASTGCRRRKLTISVPVAFGDKSPEMHASQVEKLWENVVVQVTYSLLSIHTTSMRSLYITECQLIVDLNSLQHNLIDRRKSIQLKFALLVVWMGLICWVTRWLVGSLVNLVYSIILSHFAMQIKLKSCNDLLLSSKRADMQRDVYGLQYEKQHNWWECFCLYPIIA